MKPRGAALRFPRARTRPSRRRVRRRAGGVAAGLLAALLIAAGALYLRLAQGPVSLAALATRLEAAANAGLDGAALSIGDLTLSLGDAADPRPGLRLEGLRLADAEGRTLISAPRARVEFRPLDLLAGDPRVTRVAVLGASTRVTRDAEGRLSVGFGAPAAEPEDAPPGPSTEALGALLDDPDGPLSSLETVELRDARLVYRDRMTGRVWRADRADLIFRRGRDGRFRAVASALLPDGALGPGYVRAEASQTAASGLAMRLNFSGVAPADLALQFPDLAPLAGLDAPLQGRAAFEVDAGGDLTAFSAEMRAAAGAARLPAGDVPFERARLVFSVDPERDLFDIKALEVTSALGDLSATGRVALTAGPDGAPAGAVIQLRADRLVARAPGRLAGPVGFDRASLTARVDLAPFTVELAAAQLARGDLTLDVSGKVRRRPEGWRGALRAQGRDAALSQVLALWPPEAAPGARRWIAANMTAGHVGRVDAELLLRGGAPLIGMSFAFREAVAHYLRPLPPITGAAGWAELVGNRFALTLAEGAVAAPGGGAIDLAGSSFTLPDIEDPASVVRLEGTGPLPAALEILDGEPLALVSGFGLDPRGVEGRARAAARIAVPLLKDLKLAQIAVDLEADLLDLALTPPGLARRLVADRMRLAATTAGLRLTGPAEIGGLPARLDWRETFSPGPGAPRARIAVAATATPERLAAQGVELGARFAGAAPVEAEIALGAEGARFAAVIDLGPAALAVPEIGWSKAEGEPASLTVSGVAGDGATVDAFAFSARGAEARGALSLAPDGALRRLSFSRLAVGDAADLAVEARREGESLRLELTGARLDLAALDIGPGDGVGGGGGLEASLAVDALGLGPLGELSGAEGTASLRPGGAVSAELSGRLGGVAPARLAFEGPATGGRVTLASEDAGALLRAAGLYAEGIGGRLRAEAEVTLAPELTLDGAATITGIRVADDEALRRLIAETRAENLARRAAGQGLRFDEVRADFRLGEGFLHVEEGVAIGPSIGITLEGDYDLAADQLAMRGVLTPLYAVNAALGEIPILGDLLTGGSGEGLIGFNYVLSGPADDPEIAVDPFSGFLPGPLRRLLQQSDQEDIESGRARIEELRRLRDMMQ